jgi:BirA family transcriptional regulator, biotin operon repressor / biotin---[acetyl-CoA-carboxylase] ligase
MAAMASRLDWSIAADPLRRIGHAIEFHAEIGSTNDRAREALQLPGGDGLAIVADLQTAGRGRRGRSWTSPAGANLLVSVGVRPAATLPDPGLLGFAAALATREACAILVPNAGLQIRWPNDVVDASGRKVAGLLVETALEGDALVEAVIGIGINANWLPGEMPAELAERATSLRALLGQPVDRVQLLSLLLGALDGELAALERRESPLTRLRASSWLDGREVVVDVGTELIEGRVSGLAADGSLLLDTALGHRALAVGEVVRVADRPVAGLPA